MLVVTPSQMRNIDRHAVEHCSIPGIVLMENAAFQIVKIIEAHYKESLLGKIVILAGHGNNGGDALAAARHLSLKGCHVEVIMPSSNSVLTEEAAINLKILQSLDVAIHCIGENYLQQNIVDLFRDADLIIDGLFGTGLNRAVEGCIYSLIQAVNGLGTPIVAIDIPSGIHGESGHILGEAIRADHTIVLGYYKTGNLLYPGRMYAGQMHVVPISLPVHSDEVAGGRLFTIQYDEMAALLHNRPPDGHKGTFGKVAVVAGSKGLTGAAALTAAAAIRTGAGLVTLGVPASLQSLLSYKPAEVMTFPLEDHGLGSIQADCLPEALEWLKDKDVLAIGPGLGKNSGVFEFIRNIFGAIDISIVLDADGLNHISKDMKALSRHAAPVILTPHPGEMARLTGKLVEDILKDPVNTAVHFAREHSVTVLLKGAASVVASPEGRVCINASGNSGMGTGGSGDVLTGMIAALIAQGYPPFEAAAYGCFIHGVAGDEAAKTKGEMGMIAGDIVEYIPLVLKKLYDRKHQLEGKETITKRIY